MKIINKIFIVIFILGAVSACDNLDLDLQQDPNQISPEQASLNDLYNNIQLEFKNVYSSAEGNPGAVARMYHAGAFTYENLVTQTTLNGLWFNAYADLFPDIDALIAITDAGGFDIHGGTARIMKAYTLMILVDLLGDVPNTNALQGTDIISPAFDSGQDVYSAADALLDEAITLLDGTVAGAPAFDNFYGGDPAAWITFARTLKMRSALNRGDGTAFSSIVSGGDFIDAAAEDFQFNYGNQRTNPNSRHPNYNNHYETGDGDYLSNSFMWMLRAEKVNGVGVTVVDPRIRYYFYRKVDDAVNQDQTTYSCHFSLFPVKADAAANLGHWDTVDPNLPYCVASADGYSGRDHMNGEGIPPDGPIRTSYGLYPFGGDFDDDATFTACATGGCRDSRVSGTTGGLGEGIEPIMLSFFTDFMRAEAALSLGTSDDPRTLLESGIRASCAKVRGFESLVAAKMGTTVTLRDGSSGTIEDLYAMTDADIDNYVTEVLAFYDAAANDSERLDVVIREFLIAAWGNGLEAYNMYRRTGFPSNQQPPLEPSAGQFPYSYLIPDVSVDRNQNVNQKSLADRVFWDDGTLTLY